jgi:hypothetical protein
MLDGFVVRLALVNLLGKTPNLYFFPSLFPFQISFQKQTIIKINVDKTE